MKRQLLSGLIVAGLLVVFGALAGACSSGGGSKDTLTVDEYIQQILAVDQAHESRAQPFRTQLDSYGQLGDDDVVPAEALTALQALVDEEGKFLEEAKDLEAPDEAAALHQEAIDALTADRDAVSDAIDQVDETTTIAELGALFESDTVTKAADRRTNACQALQQFSIDNDNPVDLSC